MDTICIFILYAAYKTQGICGATNQSLQIPRNLPAGTARPGFEIPGSTTDPLIIPPFNQVYLNHKLLTGMQVLIGVLSLPALGSHPLLPGGDFL